ncbi:MAG: hypothetical protein HZC38_02460 [Chloroflexi bacterium]|nr:hypothetical protein [Chloroflexota bacterium]
MSKTGEFIYELDSLYHQRTHWLRSVLGVKKPGLPPKFDRKRVNRGITQLQKIASDALANKLAKKEFSQFAAEKRGWHIKGHGRKQQRKEFIGWFDETFGRHQECIYIFWNRHKCIYIGRTGKGGGRPQSHFEKYWFGEVDRVDIYPVKQTSQLPKLECLAIHRFLPTRNESKAATKAWTKKCPLCRVHKDIEGELRKIYRLK